MRLPVVLPLIAVLGLGACNQAAERGAGSGDAASKASAAAVAAEVHFQPGLYQSKIDIKQLEIPGMPPPVIAMMKSKMLEKPLGSGAHTQPMRVQYDGQDAIAHPHVLLDVILKLIVAAAMRVYWP